MWETMRMRAHANVDWWYDHPWACAVIFVIGAIWLVYTIRDFIRQVRG
jgi:hypothetical protein